MARPYHRSLLHRALMCAVLVAGVIPAQAVGEPEMTLAQLRDSVSEGGRGDARFRVEGRVCGLSENRRLLALQDGSATVLLECASVPPEVSAGSRIALEAKGSTLRRSRHAIEVDTGPLIEVDDHHGIITRSRPVYLEQGLQPLRLEWFNGLNLAELKLEYEGPGISHRKVPADCFMHDAGDQGLHPGLRYQVYVKDWWGDLSDFAGNSPVKEGVTPDLDIGVRSRPNQVGIIFSGLMKIPETGNYTFFLGSDDGARVYLGKPLSTISVLSGETVVPETAPWTPAMAPDDERWMTAEGSVSFVDRKSGVLGLDVSGQDGSFHVSILDQDPTERPALLGRYIKVRGVGGAEGLVVIHRRDLQVVGDDAVPSGLLTRAGQVRRLQPDEARKPYRAQIRGVVTMASQTVLVIQDSSGGVFVRYSAPKGDAQPRPGEFWQIEGKTNPGDFSPMLDGDRSRYLGSASMPNAARPTWEQIASGSMDAEWVEIEGVVASASTTMLVILTRDGKVQIRNDLSYPLPTVSMSEKEIAALPGSVVRLRGVFTANWDGEGRVNAGLCQMGNASLSVDQLMPADPFSAEPMQATDLLRFTSHPGVFKRVKVTGTVLHAHPPELFLSDGARGFRILSREAPVLSPGDQVEASGFPRLGGPSPVLMETFVRKTGTGSLPDAVSVDSANLPNARLDSMRVTVEGSLLSDSLRQSERVLEMRSGKQRFVARLAVTGDVKPIERGSLLRLTGIYASAAVARAGTNAEPFELLLNHPEDIQILERGPWWTLKHTIILISILSGVLLLVMVSNFLLRRTVVQRTRELALEMEERQVAERNREVQEERTRVAHDLHDELGAGLTEAGILTSLVKNPAVPAEKKDGYLEQLAEVCRGLVTGLDEIVWAVNPRYDSVGDLAGYFSLFAQRFLDLAGIQCRLQIADAVPEHPLASHVRHHLFLAFKEALNNIVRHSGASEVKLAIGVADRTLTVELADNGRGLEPGNPVPGSDGLAGMKGRMEKLGGECRVASSPGETTVEFRLPLERSIA
ncbi:ATP-binding protein [Luteolibacter soli]|uniref:histidine kinase n=1 Tax=Luteolibacter soli TaxID=3135280 RepID=A0ABU9B0F1_9BACT